jgi:hypothetical protein
MRAMALLELTYEEGKIIGSECAMLKEEYDIIYL